MKRCTRLSLALAVAAGSASTVVAQSVVVPNSFAGTAGLNGLNTLIRDSGNPRTAQLLMNSSELTTVPPGSQMKYLLDEQGMVRQVWILTPAEANRR